MKSADTEKPKIHVPEPAPAAAAPAPNVAERAKKDIAAVKTGADPLRPIRTTGKFIGGTLTEGLNGMARYGRKGLWVGIGLGIVAGIACGFGVFIPVALAGLAAGAIGGTAMGVLTGGMGAVGRDYRAKKYADDLVQRKTIQNTAGPNPHDYRAAYRQHQLGASFNTQQLVTRTNENTRDFNTYWQDREADRRHRLPQEQGMGF